MKWLYKGLLVLIGAIFSYTASGQEGSNTDTLKLSLAEAQNHALQYNRSLLNAKDQIAISNKKLWETIASGLPQIEGSLDYMTYFNYEMEFSLASGSSSNIDFNSPPFDDGDRAMAAYLGQMFGSSEPIVMSDQFSGKVQLSQLIFSGQYYAGIRMAKIAQRLANQSLTASTLDVKENIINTYYVILTTEQSIKILEQNISNLNDILIHTTNLYKTGVAEETDVDQIKITVSQLKNSQKSLERMNQLNYNMLKFQLGVTPNVTITLVDSLNTFINNVDNYTPGVSNFDLRDNINYQMMESQVSLSKKEVDLNNWAYTPTIAGYYSYTKKFKTTGFDMTPNNLAGISVTVPILSSGMRMSKVLQAKINLDIAQRNQEMLRDQLETQQKQLLFNYQNALDNYNTQKDNVATAERVYTRTQNKFKQGLASSFDLTQANSNYLTAENNYWSSVLTLLQAQLSLDKLYSKL
ncbi:hypothetical protein CYCD_18500 [Tenuifilaceae bacterium CYCD]|nr:hypothetical protein CYCD_18500 [Tenuifilaceae bacterium CYCD]